MPRDTDATVLIIDADSEQAEKYADWLEEYAVRTASDGDHALDALAGVDVVLLDGDLSDPTAAELLGRLRARNVECQIGLLSSARVGPDVFQLDIDEYVPRPIDRTELRETVARLVDRGAISSAVETYLALVARRRQMERRKDNAELADNGHYRELTAEIVARRRQIETLLAEVDNPAARQGGGDGTDVASRVEDVEPPHVEAGEPSTPDSGRPLYRTRHREFYGLWFLAAVTYGVGDIVSTLYATLGAPGLAEANPVVDGLLSTVGIPGFLLLKLFVLFVLVSISVQGARQHERFSYYWPPVVATGVGLLLTGWNVRLVVGA